jgi:hypothetical protein
MECAPVVCVRVITLGAVSRGMGHLALNGGCFSGRMCGMKMTLRGWRRQGRDTATFQEKATMSRKHIPTITSKQCEICGATFTLDFSHGVENAMAKKFCSRKCNGINRRKYKVPLAERFWDKVNKDGSVPEHCQELGPCWVWTGSTIAGKWKYGKIGSDKGCGAAPLLAHRVSWEFVNGPIPEDTLLLHKCDNPGCVRLDHLFLGDHKANVDDMIAKGRGKWVRGVDSASAILDDDKVRQIRERKKHGLTERKIAGEFGVHKGTIHKVLTGESWAHVT